MRIYLAGPMRGLPAFNWPAFDAAASRLRGLGFEVVNPADLDRRDGILPDSVVTDQQVRWLLQRDHDEIITCEAVVVLPGWEVSRGARTEVELARDLGLDLIEFDAIPVCA